MKKAEYRMSIRWYLGTVNFMRHDNIIMQENVFRFSCDGKNVFLVHILNLFFNWNIIALQLYQLLLYSYKNSAVSIQIYPPSTPALSLHPIPHPAPLRHHRALRFLGYTDSFPIALSFTHGSIYISICISQFVLSLVFGTEIQRIMKT